MDGFGFASKYSVKYCLDLDTNQYSIEFYTKQGYLTNDIPLGIVHSFYELNNNLKSYILYKNCYNCNNYVYSSNVFGLDFKTASIGDLAVNQEHITLLSNTADGYNLFKLFNNFTDNSANLHIGFIPNNRFEDIDINRLLRNTN